MVTKNNNNTVGSENYGIKVSQTLPPVRGVLFDHQNKDADRRRKRKRPRDMARVLNLD